MNTNDPKKKVAEDIANDYDADSKVINQQNPVKEGTEESSINSTGETEYNKLNKKGNYPKEQEEYIDDDEPNIKPEN